MTGDATLNICIGRSEEKGKRNYRVIESIVWAPCAAISSAVENQTVTLILPRMNPLEVALQPADMTKTSRLQAVSRPSSGTSAVLTSFGLRAVTPSAGYEPSLIWGNGAKPGTFSQLMSHPFSFQMKHGFIQFARESTDCGWIRLLINLMRDVYYLSNREV